MTEEQSTYEEWLENTNSEDTEENSSCYEFSDDESSTWFENHPDL